MSGEKPAGPYTLWLDYGYEGWAFYDFPTIDAALAADRYGITGWVIQKHVDYDVKERAV